MPTAVQGNPTFVPNRTLFMVWGGPNDLFLALAQGNDPAAALQAVPNLAGDVLALAQLGAPQFLVPNMANLGGRRRPSRRDRRPRRGWRR